MPEKINLGKLQHTGVFLDDNDYPEFVMYIVRAKAIDKQIPNFGQAGQTSGAGLIGAVAIQNRVKKLARKYNLPDPDSGHYSLNERGEFLRYIPPEKGPTDLYDKIQEEESKRRK